MGNSEDHESMRVAEPGPPLPRVPGVQHRFVEANGIRVHVAEAGTGEPLMLIHGGPQHWYAWRHVIPALAEDYRVLCPDLRGFGWTDAPQDGYHSRERAKDMIGVLDALGLDSVNLIGHDWGGIIGFQMCLNAPGRVKRYMALSTLHPWQSTGQLLRNERRMWYAWLACTPGLGPWIQRRVPGFLRFLLGLGVRDKSIWAPGEREHYAAHMQEPSRALAESKMYRSYFSSAAVKDTMRRDRVNDRLSIPVLMLHGTRDFSIGAHTQRGWEPYADDMRAESILGGSHWLPSERPELIVERAKAFFG